MKSTEAVIYVSARSYGRWVAAALLAVVAVSFLVSVARNPNFGWPIIGEYLFNRQILSGLVLTLWLTAVAMAIGIALGTGVAVMSMSSNPLIAVIAGGYIGFFRGTPVLVQLIFWYTLAALFPVLSIGIPFTPFWLEVPTNDAITPYTAAILGLGLNEAAYMSQIVRGGLLAVDPGQRHAAKALGMTGGKALRRIVLPQAMQMIIPPAGNETIGMLKTTSLVSVIALSDLLYSAQTIYSRTFETIPLLLVACFWYLIATGVLSVAQRRLERRFGRGSGQPPLPSFKLLFGRRTG
jgi:polar amino acid transport system permease protein